MTDITQQTIIDAAKKAEQDAGGPISFLDFKRLTGISEFHLYRLFPEGGWREVKRLGDLQRHPKDNMRLTDDDLLADFHRVLNEFGKIPTGSVIDAQSSYSYSVFKRRFGGMQGIFDKYSSWLEKHDLSSPFLEHIHLKPKIELPDYHEKDDAITHRTWGKRTGPMFGPPINFRGLRHAPINEQGVVFLFGMVSDDLGFIVEAIHAAFPDCEAKRCIDHRNERWQRVKIEFEFKSSNFRDHGHNINGCDVIVCWEHDWPECPLEIVELRRVINDLKG